MADLVRRSRLRPTGLAFDRDASATQREIRCSEAQA
jgi:hypothetical protein